MNIEQLKGIGPKNQALLHKLDINTVEDLLGYYPYRYSFINIVNLNEATSTEPIYVKGTIATVPKVSYIRKNFNYLSFVVTIDGKLVNVKIFNRAFLKNILTVGKAIVLLGKYDYLKNSFMASEIKFNVQDKSIEPHYHLISGLKESMLIKWVDTALAQNLNIADHVPDYYNEKYEFIAKKDAVNLIHRPRTMADIKKAKLKLIYEELFEYTFKINVLKLKNEKVLGLKHQFNREEITDFLANLTFKLTEDQGTAIEDILNDMQDEKRMNRLVLGDVGSGKTIVAIISALANYLSGYQTAFMAPTEILAKQHYETIKNYFANTNLKLLLLTGHMRAKEKQAAYAKIQNHEVDIIIGTHALINDNVVFAKLGLVVIDEQHLFGVKQRNALQEKGNVGPDVLYLSATPIPRSYALCLYGDLDLSLIKTKPHRRKEVITKVKKENEIKDVLFKMLEEIKAGHQIFVVSPLIDESEESNLNSVKKLQEKLNTAFNNQVNISIIHGKMKQAEKDKIMNDFLAGEIKILISTTVIEVGIDIPNATMMVIFNAERFGLAALHQLRGRVGRNDLTCYCYLISDQDNARLKVMEESTDGFYISEKDFEQRGQGDLFGIKQSGDITFKLASIKNDHKILFQASQDSAQFLKSEAYLDNPYYQKILDDIMFLD